MLYNGINSLPDIRFGTGAQSISSQEKQQRQYAANGADPLRLFSAPGQPNPRAAVNDIFTEERLLRWKNQGFELSDNAMRELTTHWDKQQKAEKLITHRVQDKYPDHSAEFDSFINSRQIIGRHQPVPEWLEQELKADEAQMPPEAQAAFALGKMVYVELTAIVERHLKKADLQDEKNEVRLFRQALEQAKEAQDIADASEIEKDEDVEINAEV